jgi:hypothetical protein
MVKMSNILADDVRVKYEKAITNIRKIVENFPEDKWLTPHGSDYYLPARIAYHLAVFIDGQVAGGMKDPDFRAKLPYGAWLDATAETLPDKKAYFEYFDAVVSRATSALAKLDDDAVVAPMEPDRLRFGATQLGFHLYAMREISDHTGELNKMLIENGLDDVWVN